MHPLRPVNVADLVAGRLYMIQEKRPEYHHLKFKGVFVENKNKGHPESKSHYCTTMTHFTKVICTGNQSRGDLELPELYWNYYECDAILRAFTNSALRKITGDPNFRVSLTASRVSA